MSTQHVKWPKSHRLISSKYPPINLFEDIAPPEDWELLAQAESKTNPRIFDEIGNLSLVPVDKRVSGIGANWIMAAFTHVSTDRPSRFSDGSYGVYYCARDFETAVRETAFHQAKFFAATHEAPGWITTMRELIAPIDNEFEDIRSGDHINYLQANNYKPAQDFAKNLKENNSSGIVYPSVRHEGGECVAAFWPNTVGIPTQGGHWNYHWDGQKIDMIKHLNMTEPNFKIHKL